jgi:phosphonate degradation associated HDIG domain protein
MEKCESRVEEVFRLIRERGGDAYFGEPVSQREHALQAAWLAVEAKRRPALVVAALLHDIGHLLHDLSENAADDGVDTRHEENGYRWLLDRFGPEIAEPVRAHVAAKRYLCRVDPEYFAMLSPASVQSLALQGGPFTAQEAAAFERLPWHADAVCLRRWDDAAKIPGLKVPELDEYYALMRDIR